MFRKLKHPLTVNELPDFMHNFSVKIFTKMISKLDKQAKGYY